MPVDISKPRGRRLRIRFDKYNKQKRQYEPFKGQSVCITVPNLPHQRALYRAFVAWLESEAWKKEIREEDFIDPAPVGAAVGARDADAD